MHECFAKLQEVIGDISATISTPVFVDRETGKLTAGNLAIRISYFEIVGKRKKQHYANVVMAFCPMCGKKLPEPGE